MFTAIQCTCVLCGMLHIAFDVQLHQDLFVDNMLNCDIIVSKFELQLYYYIYFSTLVEGMNLSGQTSSFKFLNLKKNGIVSSNWFWLHLKIEENQQFSIITDILTPTLALQKVPNILQKNSIKIYK